MCGDCLWRFGDPNKKTRAWNCGARTLCMVFCCFLCFVLTLANWIRMPSCDVWVITTTAPNPIWVGHCDGGEKTLRPLRWSKLELELVWYPSVTTGVDEPASAWKLHLVEVEVFRQTYQMSYVCTRWDSVLMHTRWSVVLCLGVVLFFAATTSQSATNLSLHWGCMGQMLWTTKIQSN